MGHKFLRFVPLLLSFFISFYSSAHKCIDIDEFNFKSEGKKGLRITVFDTDLQEYEYIDYYQYPSFSEDRRTKTKLKFNYHKLKIFYDGTVEVPTNFDLSNYIIRSFKEFKYLDEDSPKEEWEEYQQDDREVLHTAIDIKTGNFILETLNRFKSGAKNPSFKVFFYQTDGTEIQKSFSNICSGKEKENRDERGRLGELATDLTFMSFGYYKHPSQNESNQGFDGVFVDKSENPELFLTESKCRNQSLAAKKILRECLFENAIYTKLQKMSQKQTQTKKRITEFLNKAPQKIFKVGYRLKINGKAQCKIEKFNNDVYQNILLATLSPDSPENEKKATLQRISRQLYASRIDFLQEAFSVAKLPQAELLTLVLEYGEVPKEKQDEVLEVLNLRKKETAKKKLNFG